MNGLYIRKMRYTTLVVLLVIRGMNTTDTTTMPKIGTAVIITRGNHVLMGLRTSKLYSNIWALPGGKLDFGETVEACCRRETLEETTLVVTGPYTKLGWEDDIMPQYNDHYVTLYVHLDDMGNDQIAVIPETEQNKCAELRWMSLEELQGLPLWPNTLSYIQKILQPPSNYAV